MAYIGTAPNIGENRKLDDISGSFNGSTTTFDLKVATAYVYPGVATSLLISVGGILQEPGSAYTLHSNGKQITFTTAPGAGADFFGVVLGASIDIGTPAADSVTTAKIADGAVTAIKLGDALGFANVAGNVSIGRSLAVGYTDGRVPQANLDVKGNTYISGSTDFAGTAAGTIGIGTLNTPSNKNTVTPILNVSGSGVIGAAQITRHTAVGGGGALLHLAGTRGSDVNSYTILQSGDGVGTVAFQAADGNEFVTAAEVSAQVDGTPGNDDMPGRILLKTTADGASSSTERVRVTSAGLVGIGTSSPTGHLEVSGNASIDRSLAIGYTDGRVPQANLEVRSNVHVAGTIPTLTLHDDSGTSYTNGANVAMLQFQGRSSAPRTGAAIRAIHDSTNGTLYGLSFDTRISDTQVESMRIENNTITLFDNTLTRANLKDYGVVTSALGSAGGARTIDLEDGNSFSATISASTVTWTFSNPTASDEMCAFSLILTNGGSQTVNWPGSVDWASATAPTLTSSGVDVLVFVTIDGGTIWHGMVASTDSS